MNEIEKAIEELQSLLIAGINGADLEMFGLISEESFSLAVLALEKQLTNAWIPCSERLPILRQHEYGEPIEYNIMINGGTVATTGCINQEGIWGWMDWNSFKFNVIGAHVIAWQPLPQSYAEVAK